MISSSFNTLFILFRKKLISHFKPGDDGVINSRIQRWNKIGALVCLFVELGVYSRHYSEEHSSKRKEEMLKVKDLGSNHTYTSKALI
ncbi:microtubule-actin cross-linking factor 1 [Biomphalaria glabrata]|nr:microtubule-actin cross-linking factor 1 [Biomphalaria glabrata]KAI8735494.1 microtubule-actin cross-linking factor 1 [Biomphalaria glabrata]